MDWFEKLLGFREQHPNQVRENILIEGSTMTSKINNRSYDFGKLEMVSLENLRKQSSLEKHLDKLSISEIIGNIKLIHEDPTNEDALFQVASQFNLLEMVGPHVTPAQGVGRYERDHTQGPACAIACGVGTIYRNYFVPVNDSIGQSIHNQIDCLEDLGKELNNDELLLWKMSNGYALANEAGLKTISDYILKSSVAEYEKLKGHLKIGIQWNTEVTSNGKGQKVTQVYSSALPVAYSHIESELWSDFACLILEATYEATLHTALLNYEKTGNKKVFLTLVGGGAFGNNTSWIKNAILNTLTKFRKCPLDIKIVSYGGSSSTAQNIITNYNTL